MDETRQSKLGLRVLAAASKFLHSPAPAVLQLQRSLRRGMRSVETDRSVCSLMVGEESGEATCQQSKSSTVRDHAK